MTPARECLELLAANDGAWLFGLDMVKRSRGLKRGTVYVHLGELEDAGYVRSKPGDIAHGLERRVYQLTSSGRAALLRDDL